MHPVDILAIGPHPDDIEIGIGGTVALHVARGYGVGLCDLTRGEMGSNGTPEQRVAEGEAACRMLGATWRVNLALPDRQIGASPDHLRRVAEAIRTCKPQILLAPYWDDRHPDHGAASRLVTEAVFSAGLRRYEANGDPWRPRRVCYYFINDSAPPSFVVDVSEQYETKRAALACYTTQFRPQGGEAVSTRLTSPLFGQLVESRDAQFGALAGVRFAEGFITREPLLLRDLIRTKD